MTERTDTRVKLWHDDIRRPPDDSWTWARTNREAVAILLANNVAEASLDHDLGLEDHDPDAPEAFLLRGHSAAGDGVDLVKAMLALRIVPPRVTVHSWNPEGAAYMAGLLSSLSGAAVEVRPFEVPGEAPR